MDYFKTAATALLSKGGPLPNYNIGERDAWFEGRTIWSLHEGTKRVSVREPRRLAPKNGHLTRAGLHTGRLFAMQHPHL